MHPPPQRHFDGDWCDAVFDPKAFATPLVLPDATPPNNRVWVGKRPIRQEGRFAICLCGDRVVVRRLE